MTSLAFVRQSNRNAGEPTGNPSRLLNLYPEPTGQGGRTAFLLQPCKGLQNFAPVAESFTLAMAEVDGDVYAVTPEALYRVDAFGSVRVGSLAAGQTAAISRNLGAVTIAAGGVYSVWDTAENTLTPYETADVSPAWVDYLAGRTIVGGVDGRFAWSDVGDATTFPGLNFATAEARDDAMVRGIVAGNSLYLMGERTTEIWVPYGSGATAFQPSGAVLDRGLKAFSLLCLADGALFFVGDDNIAYLMAGNQVRPVSNAAVTQAIEAGQPQSCMFWDERGHKFAAITFRDRPAWVYDMATQQWWERCERPERGAWRGRVSARLGDGWLIGGDGRYVYTLEADGFDAGLAHYCEATSYTLGDGAEWFTLAELEIGSAAGFGTGTLQIEIGDGISFGLPRHKDLPPVGDFSGKTLLRALGRHRRLVARVSMSQSLVPLYGECRVRLA